MACAEFVDDREDIGATVTVERADGTRATASADVPPGHPHHPATTDQLLLKWSTLAGDGGDRAWAAAARLDRERLTAVVQQAGMAAG